MKKRNFVLVLAVFLLIFSCKKKSESKESVTENTTKLPNYGSVDLDDVFTKADGQLSDKASLVRYIDQYYKKVWEGSDLSGGILVAKGDDILYENYRGFGREGNQMPIDKNTALHVASVSKTLTAMAMMKLI